MRQGFCSQCGQPASQTALFEKRIEYRRLSDLARYKVVKLYDICGACLEDETTSPMQRRQGTL
jgi:hypothetical protein